MAQSAKFGFGHQKEKKNLASLWSSAAFKREQGEKSSAQTQWRVQEGKTPVCTSQPPSPSTPPKKSGQTDVSPLPVTARERCWASLSLCYSSRWAAPGERGADPVLSAALPKGQDTGPCRAHTCQANAAPAHGQPHAGHRATMPRGVK